MADKTKISWTDATWNPVRGCSRVSEGCRHCYAEQQAARIVRMGKGAPTAYDGLVKLTAGGEPRWAGEVRLVPDALALPLRWSKPRRIFVNSMSDLFHESLDDEEIDLVFAVMLLAPRHTFQVLTKRADRMRRYFEDGDLYERILAAADRFRRDDPRLNQVGIGDPATSPARWIWLGVSVENQDAANERIPELLATPAAVRFLSCEPLLEAVWLREEWMLGRFVECPDEDKGDEVDPCMGCPAIPNDGKRGGDYCGAVRGNRVDWLIAGCESGPGARPCSVEWLRSLRDQCAAASVPFFLKQAVEDIGDADQVCDRNGDERGCGQRIRYHTHGPHHTSVSCGCTIEGAESANWRPVLGMGDGSRRKPGGVIELPYLDGVQHAAMPEVDRG